MLTRDGIELHLRRWPAPQTRRGSLLIVHGLGEHSGRYDHVAEAIAGVGLEVASYDLRGHGRSGGPRGGLPRPEALLDDLREVFDALAAEDGGPPPFLLGHSLGGAIAARAATGGWVRPRGLVLSSPALAANPTRVQKLMAAVGRRLIPDRPVPNGLPLDGLSHDLTVIDAYKADEHVHDRITARLYDFLIDAGERSRADAHDFRIPTLILAAGSDRFVDATGSRAFADALPDGVGTLHWYDELYHEILNEREPDRARVLGDLTAWLRTQL